MICSLFPKKLNKEDKFFDIEFLELEEISSYSYLGNSLTDRAKIKQIMPYITFSKFTKQKRFS